MATKTISIDLEAYEALRRRKRRGESFSDVIKKHFTRGATGRELRRALDDLRLDASTLDAADELVARRSEEPATAPEL
ncbi:MAG TPA: antitoxin VapB family protein [Gemmatimonadota bacterium]|nr:antitoxin VapB family protein [Gemmatimonadota bacterium]